MIFNTKIGGGSGEPGELGIPTVSSSGLVTTSVTKTGLLKEGTSTSLQLSTQAAKTVTPSTSAQTAVAAGKYTTGAVKVAAIPSGAGAPIATGTWSPRSDEATFNLTGLSFTPVGLMIVASGYIGNSQQINGILDYGKAGTTTHSPSEALSPTGSGGGRQQYVSITYGSNSVKLVAEYVYASYKYIVWGDAR